MRFEPITPNRFIIKTGLVKVASSYVPAMHGDLNPVWGYIISNVSVPPGNEPWHTADTSGGGVAIISL